MIKKFIMARPLGDAPTRSNICPECKKAQILKWDSVGDGKNITLTDFSHQECLENYFKNISEFDYEVTISGPK